MFAVYPGKLPSAANSEGVVAMCTTTQRQTTAYGEDLVKMQLLSKNKMFRRRANSHALDDLQ
jgi:hypothetical protein